MKDNIAENPNDPASLGSGPLERVARRKRRATLFASLLITGILLRSFLILFATHRPGVDRSNQAIPTTASTAPGSWPRSAIFGAADSTLYTPRSLHYLFAL